MNVLAVLIAAVILALLLFPHDRALLIRLHAWPVMQDVAVQKMARALGFWGDYPTYNLPLALMIWGFGVWRKSRVWRRIGIVCLLGGTLAGLLDDCFRLTLGRARPDANMPDGFYGLPAAFRSSFQSFPSGHAAAVSGTAAALLVICRPLGWIAAGFALLVIWARMEIYRHYPSDIAVGALVGISMGLFVGYGAGFKRQI